MKRYTHAVSRTAACFRLRAGSAPIFPLRAGSAAAFWLQAGSAAWVAAFLCLGDAVAAQRPPCAMRAAVVGHLAEKYKERPVAIGLSETGGVFELLTAPAGETWTVIVTWPNGVACLIAAGRNWVAVPKPPPSPDGSGTAP